MTRGRALLLGAFIATAGCGKLQELWAGVGDEDESKGDDAKGGDAKGDDAGPPPSADGECGGADFPCSWGEVSAEVVARMQATAGRALEMYGRGLSASAVAAKLEEAGDVVVLGYSDDSIRYRVTGGRPAWVFLATAGALPSLGGGISMSPASPGVWGPWIGPPPSQPQAPAGETVPGTRPEKKALILSPFRWQWQLDGKNDDGTWVSDDEVETLVDFFDDVEDYPEGSVVLKQNTWTGSGIEYGVSTFDFASWRDYDVIHVSTHGTSCDKPTRRCLTALATGELWPDMFRALPQGVDPTSDPDHAVRAALMDDTLSAGFDMGFMPVSGWDAPTLERMGLDVIVAIAGPAGDGGAADGDESALMASRRRMVNHFAGPFVLVNSRFFEQTYQDRLTDKIIFVSACKSGTKSDLLDALAGPATAVIGWDKVMQLSTATAGAVAFWARLTDPGTADANAAPAQRVEPALESLQRAADNAGVVAYGPSKSIVIEGVVAVDDRTGAKLGAAGDTTTRAREIVRLLQPDGKSKLEDGQLLTLVGAAGDGKPDDLELHAEVMGIDEDDRPGDYVVHVDVEGRTATGTIELTQKVRPGVWRGKAQVELGFDLAEPTFMLEPWVELPTGGTSRWYYEDIGVEHMTFTVSGAAFAGPQTFSIPPEHISLSFFDTSLLVTYLDKKRQDAVSADSSVINHIYWGISPQPEVGLADRTFEFGGKDGGWGSKVYLNTAECGTDYGRCVGVTLKGHSGSVTIKRYELGKHITRRELENPSIVTGTFEGTLRAAPIPFEGEIFEVEGSFALMD